jgi:hypothetical protein
LSQGAAAPALAPQYEPPDDKPAPVFSLESRRLKSQAKQQDERTNAVLQAKQQDKRTDAVVQAHAVDQETGKEIENKPN